MRVLALLAAAVLPLAVTPHVSSAPRAPRNAVPNDNRRAAGSQRGDTLTARFTVQLAHWAPEGAKHKQIDVEAMTEDGQAPTIPAPMLRVRTGTVLKVTVRNALPDSGIRVFGLWAHPAAGKDTTAIKAGASHEFVFEAGAPGTYFYGAAIDHATNRGERETALGAFIVDSAGPVPPDRVMVMNIWSDSTGNALAINGLSWPQTERIETRVGDTLRWRVINPTIRAHPMHLHGFYFTLLSRGDAKADTTFAPSMRFDEVTERMRNNSTMTMQWTPDRPGNWLFHCHIAFHVVPEAAQLATPDSTHDETHSADPNEHMRGLIVGIVVKKRRGYAEASRADTRTLQLDVNERTPRADKRRRLEYRLAGTGGDTTWRPGGPMLILQQGQPTDITVANHLHETTAVHWHGIELESYSDGIAGWSGMGKHIMPVIAPGESFTARLTLPRAGTFMYHTHLGDLEQLTHGLYGALVVMPKGQAYNPALDHVYLTSVDGPEDLPFIRINGDSASHTPLEMRVGEAHRLRFINIMAAIDMRWILQRDSTTLTWMPMAKDGTELPAARRVASPANVRVAVGETRDVIFTPTTAGEFKLRGTVAANIPGWTQRIIVRP